MFKGILLARYFKQTWVGSSLCGKDIWFAVSWPLLALMFVSKLTPSRYSGTEYAWFLHGDLLLLDSL
jgi:hypothetical protein